MVAVGTGVGSSTNHSESDLDKIRQADAEVTIVDRHIRHAQSQVVHVVDTCASAPVRPFTSLSILNPAMRSNRKRIGVSKRSTQQEWFNLFNRFAEG